MSLVRRGLTDQSFLSQQNQVKYKLTCPLTCFTDTRAPSRAGAKGDRASVEPEEASQDDDVSDLQAQRLQGWVEFIAYLLTGLDLMKGPQTDASDDGFGAKLTLSLRNFFAGETSVSSGLFDNTTTGLHLVKGIKVHLLQPFDLADHMSAYCHGGPTTS